jgi:hypothetical protein
MCKLFLIFLFVFTTILLFSFADFSNIYAQSATNSLNKDYEYTSDSNNYHHMNLIKNISSNDLKVNDGGIPSNINYSASFIGGNYSGNLIFNNSFCCLSNLDDNFSSPYYLGEGKTSPDGKWKNVYSGFGSTGVENDDKNYVFFLKPMATKTSNDTQAALVRSNESFCNFDMNVDVNTVKQLRENSPPNAWESGWIFFRFTDTFHYYWFTISPEGIELGKKDCDACQDPVDGQQYLVTNLDPKLELNSWSHWNINAIGNHIKVFVNGNLVVDYIDKDISPKIFCGNIAMYTEDAYVRFDNMHLKSL